MKKLFHKRIGCDVTVTAHSLYFYNFVLIKNLVKKYKKNLYWTNNDIVDNIVKMIEKLVVIVVLVYQVQCRDSIDYT